MPAATQVDRRPDVQEIRLALRHAWDRDRPDDHPRHDPIKERLQELVALDVQCDATRALWEYVEPEAVDEVAEALRLRDAYVDEAIAPLLASFETDVLEAMLNALRRWSDEYPAAQRAGEPDPRFVRTVAS